MKKLVFLFSIFSVLQANAQDYMLTFEGTGAVKRLSTVKVENLTDIDGANAPILL